MAVSYFSTTLIIAVCFISVAVTRTSRAAELSIQLPAADEFEWPAAMSLYDGGEDMDEEAVDVDVDVDEQGSAGRRSLFWRRMRYYISYGALSANRIPCPPRSGRSYYTHNCFGARGPVRPYYRGCSAITRCRR